MQVYDTNKKKKKRKKKKEANEATRVHEPQQYAAKDDTTARKGAGAAPVTTKSAAVRIACLELSSTEVTRIPLSLITITTFDRFDSVAPLLRSARERTVLMTAGRRLNEQKL